MHDLKIDKIIVINIARINRNTLEVLQIIHCQIKPNQKKPHHI